MCHKFSSGTRELNFIYCMQQLFVIQFKFPCSVFIQESSFKFCTVKKTAASKVPSHSLNAHSLFLTRTLNYIMLFKMKWSFFADHSTKSNDIGRRIKLFSVNCSPWIVGTINSYYWVMPRVRKKVCKNWEIYWTNSSSRGSHCNRDVSSGLLSCTTTSYARLRVYLTQQKCQWWKKHFISKTTTINNSTE